MKLKKMKLALLGLVVAGLSSTVVAHNPASTAYVDAKIAELAARTTSLTEADWEAACPGAQDFEVCYPLQNQSLSVSNQASLLRVGIATGFFDTVGISPDCNSMPPKSIGIVKLRVPQRFEDYGLGGSVSYEGSTGVSISFYHASGAKLVGVGYSDDGNNKYVLTNEGPFTAVQWNTGRSKGDRSAYLYQGIRYPTSGKVLYAIVAGRTADTDQLANLEPTLNFEWK